jgi:outer membrane autotransporter protein
LCLFAAILTAIATGAGLLLPRATAAESIWTGSGADTDFSTAANWSAYSLANDFTIGKAPASGIPHSGTATLAGALTVTGQYLSIGYENTDDGAGELRLTGTLNLTRANGILMIARAAAANTANGSVYLSGNALLTVANEISVGRGGVNSTGYMEIAGNAIVRTKILDIATGASLSGTITNLRGELLVKDNALLETGSNIYIGGGASDSSGNGYGQTGLVTIADAAHWLHAPAAADTTSVFQVGASASGTLVLRDSGSLTINRNLAGAVLTIARSSNAVAGIAGGPLADSAIILRDNAALTASANPAATIVVGQSGRAHLTLAGAATLTAGRILIASLANARGYGNVNLDGGLLAANAIEAGDGIATLAFAGGTLRALSDNPAFIAKTGTGTFNTTVAPGATVSIDSNNHNIGTGITFTGTGGAADDLAFHLAKHGAGTLTLSAVQLHTGTTTIAAGALALTTENALASSAAIHIAGAGTLATAANQTLQNPSSNNHAATIAAGTAGLTLHSTQNTAFTGNITAANLAKTGAGTLTLNGTANASLTITTGALALGTGTLRVNAPATLATGATLAISAGAGAAGAGRLDATALTFAPDTTLDITGHTSLAPAGTGTATLAAPVVIATAGAAIATLDNLSLLIETAPVSTTADTFALPALAQLGTGTLAIVSDLVWTTTNYAAHGTYQIGTGTTFRLETALADRSTGAGFTPFENWDGKTLAKTGAGTLTLAAANTHTGTTLVAAGALELAAPDAIAASTAVQIAANATLTLVAGTGTQTLQNLSGEAASSILNSSLLVLNSTAPTTYSGNITGTGAVVKTGAATLSLTGPNSTSTIGDLTLSAGALALATGTVSASGTITLASTGTLGIAAGSALLTTGTAAFASGAAINILSLAGTGDIDLLVSTADLPAGALASIALYNNGVANTVSLDTYNLYELKTDAAGKKLQVAGVLVWNSTGTAHGTYNIAAGAEYDPATALADRAAATFTPFAAWDGKSLTKTGAGTLKLATAAAYTGTTFVNAGVLELAIPNAIATSSAVQIAPAAILRATGTQTLNNLASGGPGGTSVPPVLAAAGGSVHFILYQNFDTTYAGQITGPAGITKTGPATLTLSGSSDFTGGATIAAGRLTAARADALGTGPLAIAADATVEFGGASASAVPTEFTGDITGALTGSGTLLKTGAATVTLAGPSLAVATIVVNAGTLALGDATSAAADTAAIATGANLTLGAGSALALTGAAAFAENSALSLIIGSGTGPALAAAGITLGAGVALNIAGVTGDTTMPFTLVQAAGAITGDFATVTIGGGAADYLTITTEKTADARRYLMDAILTWNAPAAAHGTFTLADATDEFTLAAPFADRDPNPATGWDGKSLEKAGPGTLILAAQNTYTGATLVTAGTLQLAAPDAIATSTAVQIAANATLALAAATGTQTLQNLSGEAASSILNSSLLILNSTAPTTYSGNIAGTGAVVKTGSATLTLAPAAATTAGDDAPAGGVANTFTGPLTVAAGRLAAAGLSALGTGTAIHIAAGAALELVLTPATADTLPAAATGTLAHALSGDGVFAFTTTGSNGTGDPPVLAIATANPAFTGTALIAADGGKLLVTHPDALGAATAVVVANATLEYRDIADSTLQNTFAGDGTLLVTTSTLTLATPAQSGSGVPPLAPAGTSNIGGIGAPGIAAVRLDRSTLTLAHARALGAAASAVTAGPGSRLVLAAGGIRLAALTLDHATLAFAKQTPAAGAAVGPDLVSDRGATQGRALQNAASAPAFLTVETAALAGTGTIAMNVDLSRAAPGVNPGGTAADFLRITGPAAGAHAIALDLAGTRPAAHGVSIELIQTAAPAAGDTFALTGATGKITVGLIAYEFRQGDGTALLPENTSWYLADTGYSAVADTILAHSAMLAADWHHSLDSLHLRMGDLRATPAAAAGKNPPRADRWLRFRASRLDSDNTASGTPFDQIAWGLTLGADKRFRSPAATTAFVDLGYLNRRHDTATVDTKNLSAGLYATWLHDAGWFADAILRLDRYDTTLALPARNAQIVRTDFATTAAGASLELGKRITSSFTQKQPAPTPPSAAPSTAAPYDKSLYNNTAATPAPAAITPENPFWLEFSVQFAALRIAGADYDIHPEQMRLPVHHAPATSIQTRAIIRAGRDLGKLHPHLRLALARGDTRGGRVRVTGLARALDYDDLRAELGAGFAYAISPRAQFHLDCEYSRGDTFTRPWSINTGYRQTW